MRKIAFLFVAFIILTSHDMFLKMDSYFLPPNVMAKIQLYNGTFTKSENIISRDRMIDVCMVSPKGRERLPDTKWTEQGKITILNVETGIAGTYLAGVSTKAKTIELSAKDFNDYLKHDGILDVLEDRGTKNLLDKDAVELYSKHVKAIFQVGDEKTNNFGRMLNYPIEFVPLTNPYLLSRGDNMIFQLLRSGKPLPSQLVYVGQGKTEAHQDGQEDHQHYHEDRMRTDADGKIEVLLKEPGHCYLRTIHMVEHADANIDYESNWATITFEIR